MENDITTRHKFITWFASNPVVANLLMVCILCVGVYYALSIRKEAFPSFDSQRVTINIPIRGGNPEDVEKGVTIKVEEALDSVDGIENISSTSSRNNSSVRVEAIEGYPLSKLLNDIKLQVDAIQNLPENAENPVITESKRAKQVLWVEVTGEGQPEAVFKETAREVRDALLAQPSISKVSIDGSRDYEISINLSEEKLLFYNLTFDEVATAIQRNSIDSSGGTIKSNRGDISLRMAKQAYNKDDYENIPIRSNPNGTRIYLKDIAEVVDGFVEQVYLNRFNGKNTVSLQVVTEGNEDIVNAVADAHKVIAEYSNLPEGLELKGWLDGTTTIRDRLNLLVNNGLSGIALVLIILAVFLNLRLAFWVAVGIPVSFAGALILFPTVDLSINLISAFGFLVVLGIVVDDAIVIGESIYTEKQLRKTAESYDQSIRSTVRGVSKVVIPASFGVITTIAAFIPLTQVSGRQGNIFGQLAIVVIFCLIFSLVESKLILPAHLAHLDVNKKPRNPITKTWGKFQKLVNDAMQGFVHKVMTPTLRFLVPWRYSVLVLFIVIFGIFASMVYAGKIRASWFPEIYRDSISISLELEQGQSVEYLHETGIRITEAANQIGRQQKDKKGGNPFANIQISSSSNSQLSITAEMTNSSDWKEATGEDNVPTKELISQWRKIVGPIPGAKSLSFSATAGPRSDITINLESENLKELQLAAIELKKKLEQIEGVHDASDSFDAGMPEITYDITPAGEAANIDPNDLSSNVRDAFFGRQVQRIQRGRDEVRVMLKFPEEQRTSLDTLRDMRIRTNQDTAIPFSVAADTKFGESLASIQRYDGKRIVSINASTNKAVTSGEQVLANLEENYFPDLKAQFPTLEIKQSGRTEERLKSRKSMQFGFLLAIILIYVLLAIPLKSYTRPLYIMIVIPFGIIGALMGHYILDITLSILSLFGILALSGVVVNDSLVLVSRIMDLTKEGVPYRTAVIEAAGQRFRAILLTSLTTFFGLFPITYATSLQAQFLKPMAASLAFGVAFATLITLLLLPMILLITNDIKRSLCWLYNKEVKE